LEGAAASLVSSRARYLNEQGITNRIVPHEVMGDGVLVRHGPRSRRRGRRCHGLCALMRTTKPQSRDAAQARLQTRKPARRSSTRLAATSATRGASRPLRPAPFSRASTTLHAGTDLVVSARWGNKIIHPFSDFALAQRAPGQHRRHAGERPAILRTSRPHGAAVGLRFRSQMLHDGSAEAFNEAINQHEGEADFAQANFQTLSNAQKTQLFAF